MSSPDFSGIQEKGEMLVRREILTKKGLRKLRAHAKRNHLTTRNENVVILRFLLTAFYLELWHRSQTNSKLEKKIKAEDEPVDFYWAMPLLRDKVRGGLIHPARSTTGKTRTRTLRELRDIGLVIDVTFKDAELKLKHLTIVNEGSLVAFLLQREQELAIA